MSHLETLFITFLLVTLAFVKSQDSKIKSVCSSRKFQDECEQINRGNLRCHEYKTNIDCMLNLQNGTTTFALLKPDEAILGSGLLNNLTVVGEVRPWDNDEENNEFEIVVLVKQKFEGFKDLKNKRYCHPGFGKLKGSLGYLTYFENTLINTLGLVDCNDESNILPEKHLNALNEFFGESCRPGSWLPDVAKDAELKTNFTKLCALCSENNCSGKDIIDPFISAMGCFMDKGGDIVITSLKAVKTRPDLLKPLYLCPDGKTSENICFWSKRPWNLILSNKLEADNVQEYLRSTFKGKLTGLADASTRAITIDKYLDKLLFPSTNDKLYLLPDPKDLKEYIKNYTLTPTKPICDNKMRWCTTSNLENNKCLWFNQAVLNEGINLEVQCILRYDQLQCLDDIKLNKVDIITIDNDYGFAARRKNLIPVAFPETAEDHLTKSMIVVKDKDLDKITGISGMKDSYVCFSEFGNLAFVSWLELLKEQDLVKKDCDYGNIVSKFVGDSCAPGVIDSLHEKTGATDTKKLCNCVGSEESKTATNCNADKFNKYFKTGVINCLDESGQFAVMTNKDIPENVDESLYRIICKNGSFAANSGFDVDEDCYISVTINTEVIVQNNSNFNNYQFYMELFEIIFGQNMEKSFALFGIFNNTEDLMFKQSTPGLDFKSSDNTYIGNYLKTFKTYDSCVERGDSGSILYQPYPSSLVAAFIIFLLM